MGLSNVIVKTVVVLLVIFYVPGLPPYSSLEPFSPRLPSPFEGALDPKDYALSKAEKLFQGELIGPECLEASPVDPDVFYTTLHGGTIVKISGNGTRMQQINKFGKTCAGNWDSQNCGRPLGIRFDKDGHLIAADAYLGIYKVDLESGNGSY